MVVMSTDAGPLTATLRDAALDALVGALREALDVGRCTLRLDRPGETFPVVHESRAPGVGTLIGETTVVLKGQPVVEAMLAGVPQVVQDDCATASDDPAFQRMLGVYGGMASQIVTAVRVDGELRGIVSLHQLGTPRRWTAAETEAATRGAGLIGAVLAEAAR
jgi:GAF domain-containing protein